MLKQNLNDKCYSMANIFSFAEKVIPGFKNKSEGDKFLLLYCITAKLLSNRLYDYETAEDKIKCLLSRIPKDKKENAEQLTELLKTFVGENDFSVDKVKSFFDTNTDLLNKIYGNEKPADLLLFFAQMQSKEIFKKENNETFVNGIENSKVEQENLSQHRRDCSTGFNEYSMYVDMYKILGALEKDPNRIFNDYIDGFNKNMKLKIFDTQKDEYKTKSFKLTNETCSRHYDENGEYKKYNIGYEQVNCDYTLDTDEILNKKFSFKKINEMSKDELEKLGLSYDEEFIYFLVSEDFSNENIFQDTLLFYNFIMPENIKPETTLKIYDYFVKLEYRSLINKSIDYLQDKFETSQSLLDTYDKLNGSLNFEKDKLLEIFIGNPPKVKQVLKCQDTKSSEEINTLLDRCEFQNVIDYFVETDDNKKQDLLSEYMLQNPEKLCDKLKDIDNKLYNLSKKENKSNNENKLKKLQNLMRSFFELKNADDLLSKCDFVDVINYFLNHDEGTEQLLKNIYNNVKKLENYFENMLKLWTQLKNDKNKTEQNTTKLNRLEYLITKFLFDCKEEVFENNQKYIDCIVDMFSSQQKFCMYDLNDKKEIDVTDDLKSLLNQLIDKNLGLVENNDIKTGNNIAMLEKNNEGKENDKVIVEVNGKLYDLKKIYFCPSENTSSEQFVNKNVNLYLTGDPVKELQQKIKFHKKILESKVVSPEKKQTIYSIAKKYEEYLQKTYNKACNKSLGIFLDNLGINQETYNRLKNANKNEMLNRKEYLTKKANVTNVNYLKENWTTWLSFLLVVPAFLYIFVWKPRYKNEMKKLETDLKNKEQITKFSDMKTQDKSNFDNCKLDISDDNFDRENDKLTININVVSYEFSESGKNHKSMIDEMDKFIKQYEKNFGVEKQDIILEQEPEMEKIGTNKNDVTSTDPSKI